MGQTIEWLRAELAAKAEELAQADAEINKLENRLNLAMRDFSQICDIEMEGNIGHLAAERMVRIARTALARLRAKC